MDPQGVPARLEGFPHLCRVWVDACVLDVLAAEAAAHGGWPDPWPALRRNQNLLLWQAAMTDAVSALRQTIGTDRMAEILHQHRHDRPPLRGHAAPGIPRALKEAGAQTEGERPPRGGGEV